MNKHMILYSMFMLIYITPYNGAGLDNMPVFIKRSVDYPSGINIAINVILNIPEIAEIIYKHDPQDGIGHYLHALLNAPRENGLVDFEIPYEQFLQLVPKIQDVSLTFHSRDASKIIESLVREIDTIGDSMSEERKDNYLYNMFLSELSYSSNNVISSKHNFSTPFINWSAGSIKNTQLLMKIETEKIRYKQKTSSLRRRTPFIYVESLIPAKYLLIDMQQQNFRSKRFRVLPKIKVLGQKYSLCLYVAVAICDENKFKIVIKKRHSWFKNKDTLNKKSKTHSSKKKYILALYKIKDNNEKHSGNHESTPLDS